MTGASHRLPAIGESQSRPQLATGDNPLLLVTGENLLPLGIGEAQPPGIGANPSTTSLEATATTGVLDGTEAAANHLVKQDVREGTTTDLAKAAGDSRPVVLRPPSPLGRMC